MALLSCASPRCSARHFNDEASKPSARPDEVLQALEIAPGAWIADIGSGGGYFALRFARAVGPRGKVFAVDVDAALLRIVEGSARREALPNVLCVLASPDAPSLPARSIDLAFVRATYHHFADPVGYFRALRPALRPRARVAIIDYRPGGFLTTHLGHSVAEERVIASMRAAGYALQERHALLDDQFFLVFAPEERR